MTATDSQIRLNDFASFDNFLFGAGKRDWRKFLDKDEYFIPPIDSPADIVQYQLCHYAYWMTIAKNNFESKPGIIGMSEVLYSCYACAYAQEAATAHGLMWRCILCPLKRRSRDRGECGDEYFWFKNVTFIEAKPNWAEKIAKMTWEIPASK